jgi:hypothetical protein
MSYSDLQILVVVTVKSLHPRRERAMLLLYLLFLLPLTLAGNSPTHLLYLERLAQLHLLYSKASIPLQELEALTQLYVLTRANCLQEEYWELCFRAGLDSLPPIPI